MKELASEIRNKKLFLLDIDGTVSFDTTLYQGAMDFFQEVRKCKGKYVFITNNSTKSVSDYVEKFEKMGVEVDDSSFLTSSIATAHYLKNKYKKEQLFVVGTKSFISELEEFGLNVTEQKEEKNIKAVVVGFDSELTYDKVYNICQLLETRNLDYIATNPDMVCPVSFGFVPDCGAICSMIETAVHRKPMFIGKPNPVMVNMAIERNGVSKEETVVIGDRLYTDIASGINAGVETVAVFTGEAKLEDLVGTIYRPSYYCNSIEDIYNSFVSD